MGDLVSFACMLVHVSPVCHLPLISFSLGHEFLPESCFPHPLQSLRILFSGLAYLCAISFTSYRALLPAQYLYLCRRILGANLAYPRNLFLASIGFTLPLASFCPLPYSSMKQFPSFFLPVSSARSASVQLKINCLRRCQIQNKLMGVMVYF